MCIQGLVSLVFPFVCEQRSFKRSFCDSSVVNKLPQQGASLIEVLVTLVLVAVGLSGMMIMQVRGLEQNQSAYLQTQAIAMAADLADRIRLNKQAALNDLYQLSATDTAADFVNPPITPVGKKLAYNDLNSCLDWIESSLPRGDAVITRNQQVISITVSWGGQDGKPASSYIHEVELI
ncbi:type IV pilus modification protein PilV [Amphritea japonica]|uniref:Type IV pilus assembly protein PilV n=1 Tax=Amphritea japonica ATCC BAA-1530 TaxID=1278309 RepID=A0A7R6STT2_9GAMM|nr:type IV pilus modification protein PilV [Amphritea japonica]BBB27734.1 type IV pilus assembly protein PilV [Amphritea japonica ATCC BAA-1530]